MSTDDILAAVEKLDRRARGDLLDGLRACYCDCGSRWIEQPKRKRRYCTLLCASMSA